MMGAAMRTPDPVEYERCLHKLSWWLDRQTKRGALYRSPDGKHHFILSSHIHTKDYRAVKNDLARLRREGGQALELANALMGRRPGADLHLPKIDPTTPPKPYQGDPPVLHVVEDPPLEAPMEAPPEEPAFVARRSYIHRFSPETMERRGRRVAEVMLRYFGGELTESAHGGRSVTSNLTPYLGTAQRSYTDTSMAEEMGYVESEWKHAVGSRSGRARAWVTDKGREAVGPIDVDQTSELAELRELLDLAERERDDAKAERERTAAALQAETEKLVSVMRSRGELQKALDGLHDERDAALADRVDLEAQVAELNRQVAELQLARPGEPKVYRFPILQAIEAVLHQMNDTTVPSVRKALAKAACTMLETIDE